MIGKTTFSWCGPLKSKEETSGTIRFLKDDICADHNLVRNTSRVVKSIYRYAVDPSLTFTVSFNILTGFQIRGIPKVLYVLHISKYSMDETFPSYDRRQPDFYGVRIVTVLLHEYAME